MIEEKDFEHTLSDSSVSSEMKFVRLERKLRADYENKIANTDSSQEWKLYTLEYMNHVAAAARAMHIEIFQFGISPESEDVSKIYSSFRQEMDTYSIEAQIKHFTSNPKNSVALDSGEKKHLRAYADAIKDVIDKSSLIKAKKDRLYDKINAFIIELDSERMPLQKFHDVVLSLAATGAEATDKLEPAWKWVRLVAQVLGVRQEDELNRLPPPPKKIEPPKRRIEPPKKGRQDDMDDSIPF